MKQSRRMSAIEALTNVFVGYGLAVGVNYIVLPLFGYHVTVTESAYIGLIFTVMSVVRSYILRRVFEALRIYTYIQERT